MFKRVIAGTTVAIVILLGLAATAQAKTARATAAQPVPHARVINLRRAYAAQLGHVKVGKPSGIVYALGKQPRAASRVQRSCTEPNCALAYGGGPVQHSPHVYLLLWGPNWSTTSEHASAAYLESFYAGLGVEPQDNWSTITSQYGDGSGFPAFTGSVYMGAFTDTSTPPSGTTDAQFGAEADAFASNQGITDLNDAQIVIATQSGTCPSQFYAPTCAGGTGSYCAYHDASTVPFTNLPYLLDAGTACGENFINSGSAGTHDGFSIVGGHEYAESITDPIPPTGWVDQSDTVSGGEIADKCAWGGENWNGNDPFGDVTLSTGSFAMQSLWSNGASGCVMSGQAGDTVTVTNPGNQTGTVGTPVSLQLHGTSSGGKSLTWSDSVLPAGLSINATTGLITGTPSLADTYDVTVTAKDSTGASGSASFTWTINPVATGHPITGEHGKCLDDRGASTANGNKIDIWTCNGTGAQAWIYTSKSTLSVLGSCLSDKFYTGAGTKLVLWSCIGNKNEQWRHLSNGEYVLATNGLCLTDPSGSSVNGTQVEIRACHDYKDQRWSGP